MTTKGESNGNGLGHAIANGGPIGTLFKVWGPIGLLCYILAVETPKHLQECKDEIKALRQSVEKLTDEVRKVIQ